MADSKLDLGIDTKPAELRGRPATGSQTLDKHGNVVIRVSLKGGVKITVPLHRQVGDKQIPWLQNQIVTHARELHARGSISRAELGEALCAMAERSRGMTGEVLTSAWQRIIAEDLVSKWHESAVAQRRGWTFRDVAEYWLSGELSKKHPLITLQKRADAIRRTLEKYVYPEVGTLPITEIRVRHFEAVYTSPRQAHCSVNTRVLTWKYMTQVMSLAEYPLELIERRPNSAAAKPEETERYNANLQPLDDTHLMGCQAVSIHDRVFWGYRAREGVRGCEAMDLSWLDLFVLGQDTEVVTHYLKKVDKRQTWESAAGVHAALLRYRERYRPGEPDTAKVFRPTYDYSDDAQKFRAALKRAGVARGELFQHDPKRLQYQVRGHDLRGLFVTVCLAAGLPDSHIRDRTGHTSSAMIEVYRGRSILLKATGQTSFVDLDQAVPELRPMAVPPLPISRILPAASKPAPHTLRSIEVQADEIAAE